MRCLLFLLLSLASTLYAGPNHNETILRYVDRAHGLDRWVDSRMLQAELDIEFGGDTVVAGVISFETNGPRARLDLNAGGTVVFDGVTCWVSPADLKFAMPRFHVLTWPWFIAAPFKIRGHGTFLTDFKISEWGKYTYWSATQTFSPTAGDTPDDWYFLYVDRGNFLLKGMGYIVTYGQALAMAEKEPHGIVYKDFEEVDGIRVATKWQFGHFSKRDGIHGNLGSGTVSNIRFVAPVNTLFFKPLDSREVKVPDTK